VLPANIGVHERAVLYHELAHQLQRQTFARLPSWASEGLATYVETLGTVDAEGWAEAGGVPVWRHRDAVLYPARVGTVLAPDARVTTGREYATAWALVHFLYNTQEGRFADLLRRFTTGQEPAAAWRAVFPEWDPAQPERTTALDSELRDYLRNGHYTATRVKVPAGVVEASERPLPAARVHDLRLSVLGMRRQVSADEVDAELAEALAEDDGNVGAAAVLAGRHDPRAPAVARAAAKRHPDDFRAWLLLAGQLRPEARGERVLDLARAAELPGATFVVPLAIAQELYGQRRPADALVPAREAANRAPGNPVALDTLGVILGALERCDEGVVVARRALEMVTGEMAEAERAELASHLRKLEECRAGAAAARRGGS